MNGLEAGRQLFEFGLNRELVRLKKAGHKPIDRKMTANDGPMAHPARLTAERDNLVSRLPARFNYKVAQSNKRLKRRHKKYPLLAKIHEHDPRRKASPRVVAKWRKKMDSLREEIKEMRTVRRGGVPTKWRVRGQS